MHLLVWTQLDVLTTLALPKVLDGMAGLVRCLIESYVFVSRWPLVGSGGAGVLGERKAQLLQLSLEAATCAQRDRFAEQPARAVAAAAAAAAAAADYIVQVCVHVAEA